MKTVLIIDDDADFRKVTRDILAHGGWNVLEADDGVNGITSAQQNRPQAVVCDLLMPRCNGFQVCRALRADPALRDLRIVVTSGRDFASDRHAALDAGADEYLAKPVRPGQLVALLARITENGFIPRERASHAMLPHGPARLKFWGVRGSTPAPGPGTVHYGGNTACVEVRAEQHLIILDAGTGLRLLGRELMSEFHNQPLSLTLLLTHTHWDHIQGLPFFKPIYESSNRLRILGYEGARHGLSSVLSGQMESPYFPVTLNELPANVEIEELKELQFDVGPIKVQACFAHHPGICVGFRLFTTDGSIAYFPDNEPHCGIRHVPERDGHDREEELRFARSQDQKIVDFLHGVDVLIMDSQYERDEYKDHVGWGHACLDDVIALAIQAEVKNFYLFHHDPDHDDETITGMVAHARRLAQQAGSPIHIEAAREGAVVQLGAAVKA